MENSCRAKCLIVAEIGVNHRGDMDLAKKLIDLAKENGADMVKFQLFDTESIIWPDKDIHCEAIRSEITYGQAREFFQHGVQTGIEVFFSVFDVERVKWCQEIGVNTYKIASSRSSDVDLLMAVHNTGKAIIQSIPVQHSWKMGNHNKPIFLLQNAKHLWCIPEYPAKVDLLPSFGPEYIYQGYSDHTIGLDSAKNAVLENAEIIEKHFAIDHQTGMDAAWSMDPFELKTLFKWRCSWGQ